MGPPLVFLHFLLFTSTSFAATAGCGSEVRLDRPGFSMEHVSVMDQGSVGLCYAYSASQMADAWRFSHGDTSYKHRTSPWVIGMQSSPFGLRTPAGGGTTELAINAIRENGSCDKDSFANHLGKHVGVCPSFDCDEQVIYSKQIETIGNLYLEYRNYWKAHARMPLVFVFSGMDINPAEKNGPKDFRDEVAAATLECALSWGHDARALPSIDLIQRLLDEGNPTKIIASVVASECKAPINKIVDLPNAETISLDQEKLEETLKEKFSQKNPQPVGINYCSRLLLFGKNTNLSQPCGDHASLVIGKRTSPEGKCQVLIRNSWGSGCATYSPDWECDQGNIWVDTDVVSQNMQSLVLWK